VREKSVPAVTLLTTSVTGTLAVVSRISASRYVATAVLEPTSGSPTATLLLVSVTAQHERQLARRVPGEGAWAVLMDIAGRVCSHSDATRQHAGIACADNVPTATDAVCWVLCGTIIACTEAIVLQRPPHL
jgi:hypothetical protein